MSRAAKPLLRRTVLVVGALLIVAMLVATGWRYAVFSLRKSVEGARPALAAMERQPIPGHANAAAWIEAGAAACLWTDEEHRVLLRETTTPMEEWSQENWDRARELTDRHAAAIAVLRRSKSCARSSYRIPYREGSFARLPNLQSIFHAQRMLMVEARVAADEDDPRRTLDALSTAASLAASLERESFLVATLSGIAAERLLLWAVADVVAMDRPWVDDPEVIRSLRSIVRRPPQDRDASWARHRGVVEALDNDLDSDDLRIMFLRTLEAEMLAMDLEAASGLPDGLLPTPDGIRGYTYIRRSVRSREGHVDSLTGLLGTPFGTSPAAFDVDVRNPDGNEVPYSKIWWRGFRMTLARIQLTRAQRQLVEVALELRSIRSEQGGYPRERPSGPGFQEPDPFTGKPLVYRLDDDGSATIAIDGVETLMQRVVIDRSAKAPPINLPPPH